MRLFLSFCRLICPELIAQSTAGRHATDSVSFDDRHRAHVTVHQRSSRRDRRRGLASAETTSPAQERNQKKKQFTTTQFSERGRKSFFPGAGLLDVCLNETRRDDQNVSAAINAVVNADAAIDV